RMDYETQSIHSAMSEDESPEITANNENLEITTTNENSEVTNRSLEATNESFEIITESPKVTEVNKKHRRNNSELWVFKEGHFNHDPQKGKIYAL
ncbi:6579_t:CDS:2, partial [Cetraspora pellucida]